MRLSILFALSSPCVALVLCGVACSSSSSSASGTSEGGADAGPVHAANGTIGAFQTFDPMPVPRGNHCSVVANGFLVVIGGNYQPPGSTSFKTTDEIDVAAVHPDGTIGAWRAAGKTPSPVSSCTAAASGDAIIIVDGSYDDATLSGLPQVAKIDAAGNVAPFTTGGALPSGARALYSSALAKDGTLYTMFADFDPMKPSNDGVTLYTAQLDPTGAPSAFTATKWLPTFLGQPEYAFAPPYAYALGGYGSPNDAGMNVGMTECNGTQIDSSGKAGASFAVAALPKATSFGKAIAVDSWVFVVGGKTDPGAKPRPDIFAGQIDASGKIASWSQAGSLPEARSSLSVAAGGDFIYVTGGGNDAGGLDTVFAAQVRY
jgi:hypothetical protein